MSPDRQPSFVTWHVPGLTPMVQYSGALVRRLAIEAREASLDFPTGSNEIGGVLFGTRGDGEVRVRASRPVVWGHERGPDYRVTARDEETLREVVEDAAGDPELRELTVVGWYRSRTQNGIRLEEEDVKLYDQCFPLNWQVVLVLHPGEGPGVRGGFFFRPARGPLRTDASYLEFDASQTRVAEEDGGPLAEPSLPGLPPPQMLMPVKRREGRRIVWGSVLAGAAVLAVLGGFWWARSRASTRETPQLSLQLALAKGQLRATWNRTAPVLLRATKATLRVNDGGTVTDFPLSQSLLRDGEWPIANESQDVSVRLRVEVPEVGELVEVAKYLGRPVVQPEETPATPESALLVEQVDALQIQLSGRARENARMGAWVETLQRQLTQLEAARSSSSSSGTPLRAQQVPPVKSASPGGESSQAQLPPAPPKPAPSPAAPAPVDSPLGERTAPTANPPPPTPAPPAGPAPASVYSGPRTGKLIWTGYMAPGSTVTIQGRRASTGSVNGSIPPVAVQVSVFPAEFSSGGLSVYSAQQRHASGNVVEPRSAQNGWLETRYIYDPERARAATVAAVPTPDNDYKLTLRAGDRPVPAVIIEWQVAR